MLGSLSEFFGLEASLEVASSVLRATRLEEFAPHLASSIGATFAWDLARVWNVDNDRVVRPIASWELAPGPGIEVTQFAHLAREVVDTRRNRWVTELPERDVSSGLWVEIASDEQVLGVLELLSRSPRDRDERLVHTVGAIGREIGKFLATRDAERVFLEQER